MKIRINQKPAGIVLVVALFILVAAGIVIASYLTLMSAESRNVGRSQVWNQCVPVMEAGVEEAFAQIHYCNNTTNLSSNNWTLATNGYYQKTRTVGTDGSYCVISIQPTMPPVIYSTAYVPVPDNVSNYISREVRVTTMNQMASGGMISKGAITMTGNARFDSYDSALGPYNPASPGTNAVAVSDSTSTGAISLAGSSKIYGMAVTGPGGSVTWSGTSAVGSTSFDNSGSGGLQTGWTANDANVQINDNTAPNTSGWFTSLPSSGKMGSASTNYTYLFNNANYYIAATVPLAGIQTMGVTGNVTIYMTGNFSIANSAYLYIAPNSSLTFYAGGSVSINGDGIANGAGSTSALTIYGLPTCTNVSYLNGGAFYGSVNAPEATLNVDGAGGAFGAYTAGAIVIGNSGAVHFDQALGTNSGVIAATWNEL